MNHERRVLAVVVVAALLAGGVSGAGAQVRRDTTRVGVGPAGTTNVEAVRRVDGRVVDRLTQEWAVDTLTATARAPVVDRYKDRRDVMLARVAARTQAEIDLARQVGSVQVSEDVTVQDFTASVVGRSRLQQVLRGTFVQSERYDEQNREYEVTVGLPKAAVVTIVREAVQGRH